MTYIVRFITEELKAGLKRANIARGKDNVISLSIFGGKKKEFEGAAGVKAEKTKTVFLGVGPTVQTSIAVYADVLYMDDSRQKAPVPAETVMFFLPDSFREAVDTLSFNAQVIVVALDGNSVRVEGGSSVVDLPAAAKPVFFAQLDIEKVMVKLPAADFVSAVRVTANALFSPSKEIGNTIGVMPEYFQTEAGAGISSAYFFATDAITVAGMSVKADVLRMDEATYAESVKGLPYFMLDAGKLSALCQSAMGRKSVVLSFHYEKDAEGNKTPKRVDIAAGEDIYQMVTSAKAYPAFMRNTLEKAIDTRSAEVELDAKALTNACQVAAIGQVLDKNPGLVVSINLQGVMVTDEDGKRRSRLSVANGEEMAGTDEKEFCVGIPLLLNALKVAGEKVRIGLSQNGLICVQPANPAGKCVLTQKKREVKKTEEPEEDEGAEE